MPEIDSQLAELLVRCEQAHSSVRVSRDGFVRWLMEQKPGGVDDLRWLDQCHAEDLYLAYACWLGEPKALEIFEARFIPPLQSARAPGQAWLGRHGASCTRPGIRS